MRKNQTSMTAIGIAILRGIESEKPAGERLCYDPYARQFVNAALYHLVRFFDRIGYSERKGPGVIGFLSVRERHIDEFLERNLAEGVQQVVILGAGLDARAYRFAGAQADQGLRGGSSRFASQQNREGQTGLRRPARPRHLCGG